MTRILLASTTALVFGAAIAGADDGQEKDKAQSAVSSPKPDDLDEFGQAAVLGDPGETITYSKYGGRYIRGSKMLGAQIDGRTT